MALHASSVLSNVSAIETWSCVSLPCHSKHANVLYIFCFPWNVYIFGLSVGKWNRITIHYPILYLKRDRWSIKSLRNLFTESCVQIEEIKKCFVYVDIILNKKLHYKHICLTNLRWMISVLKYFLEIELFRITRYFLVSVKV